MVHYLAVGSGGDHLRESDARGTHPALHRRTDQNCSLVLRFGHTNYARWIPVHPRDVVSMHNKHIGVFAELRKGNPVVKKTTHVFSGIVIDKAHEQNNASVKGDGGAVGLSENRHHEQR